MSGIDDLLELTRDDQVSDPARRSPRGVVAWVLVGLATGVGVVAALLAVNLASYALSSSPDTSRSDLVSSAAFVALMAGVLLAFAGRTLRYTGRVSWLAARASVGWTTALVSVSIVIVSVWQAALSDTATSTPWGWVVAGGLALAVVLFTLALRRALFTFAVAAAFSGALAVVASSLPRP